MDDTLWPASSSRGSATLQQTLARLNGQRDTDAPSIEQWGPEDVEIPQALADIILTTPLVQSGTTGRRSHTSRSLLTEHIAAAAQRQASNSAATRSSTAPNSSSPSSSSTSLSLDQLLGPPLRPERSYPRTTSIANSLQRTSAYRTGVAEADTEPVLGMSFPNQGIDAGAAAAAGDRTGRDRIRRSHPWTQAIDTAHRAGYGNNAAITTNITTNRASTTVSDSNNGTPPPPTNMVPPGLSTPIPVPTPAPATEAEGPASRARRTILQDTAPRPRVPGPQQVVPSGSHYSWASYVPTRSRERSTATSSRRNTTIAPSTSTASTNVDTNANANDAPGTASSAPATTSSRALYNFFGTYARPPATSAAATPAPAPAADAAPAADDNALMRTRTNDLLLPRVATAEFVRHRTDAPDRLPPRRQYRFDPSDIAPPGGRDDHIWDMLVGQDSDDDDAGWGVAVNGLRIDRQNVDPLDSQYNLYNLDAWGTSPDSGAALSRGGFNRRRQSFLSHGRTSWPDWDEDEIIIGGEASSSSSWHPTNLDSLSRSPAPIIVSERGTRRRQDDMDDMDEDTSSKRQKRLDRPARPAYLAFTSLPPTTPLPSHFKPPARKSNLLLTATEDGHPVITFSDHRAALLTRNPEDACALRTEHPIPPGIGSFYFEAEVLSRGLKANITLGFMLNEASLSRLVGWDAGTYGWHGDDGKVFEQSGDGRSFAEPWKVGEILGLGIDFTQKRAFLTRNGVLLGHVFTKLPANLHVAVGMQSIGESVSVNFSGPFKYDIDSHVRAIHERVMKALAPVPAAFSSPIDTRVPRIAGVGPASGLGALPPSDAAATWQPLPVGVSVAKGSKAGSPSKGKGKQKAKPELELPEGSALRDGSSRAQAALVLEHLECVGHPKVAAMMRAQMVARGWLSETAPIAVPDMPTDPDCPVSQYPTPAAAVATLARLLTADGTPRMPVHLFSSIDLSTMKDELHRRLKIYHFAAGAAESAAAAAEEKMDVDADADADAEGGDSNGSEESGGEEDADEQVLAYARALRAEARKGNWSGDDIALLETAGGILAGGDAGARAAETVREMRMRDVEPILSAVRESLGVNQRSLLHLAIAQTGLVHLSLSQRGDGDTGFVRIRDVLGLE